MGETTWRESDAGELPGFAEPGWAKILCNFSLRAYGERRTDRATGAASLAEMTLATTDERRDTAFRFSHDGQWADLSYRELGTAVREIAR